ncbi:hypothetical protein C0J45_9341, partial [Silurus meridionalis]
VISANAPQFNCEMEEKEKFWSELDEVVEGVPKNERLVIEADFTGHVGEGNKVDEEVMGRCGLKERNVEGPMVVDFNKRMEMAVVNTKEYKEMRQQAKRDVTKAKEKAYEELYEKMDTKEGENYLYRLARQRDRAGKDVLQVRAMKDGDGNVLTSEASV